MGTDDSPGSPSSNTRPLEQDVVTDFGDRLSYAEYLQLDRLLGGEQEVQFQVGAVAHLVRKIGFDPLLEAAGILLHGHGAPLSGWRVCLAVCYQRTRRRHGRPGAV